MQFHALRAHIVAAEQKNDIFCLSQGTVETIFRCCKQVQNTYVELLQDSVYQNYQNRLINDSYSKNKNVDVLFRTQCI